MSTTGNEASLKDIAQRCNVSIMTVSRAFRNGSVIHPETRKRILAAAEELHYHRRNRRGRPQSKEQKHPSQVQLIFGTGSKNTSYFHLRLLTAIEQKLAEIGHECIIRTTTADYNIFMRLLDNARRHRCIATLLMGDFPGEQLPALLNALPGAIVLDNAGNNVFQGACSSFSFDNFQAAQLGVSHLIRDCGRSRIVLINGRKNHFFSEELLSGYRNALAQNDLIFDDRLILHTDFSAESAASALRDFLRKNVSFDAVFTNDEMATGVYRVLLENRIRIPEDVSVCGCDDLPVGKQLYPALTSISLDYAELAASAADYLQNKESALTSPVHIKLMPRLQKRKSSIPKR